MSSPTIAINGASGGMGGRIAQRLAQQNIPLRLIVRDASRAPDLPHAEVAVASYEDRAAMLEALRGIDTVFMVSGFESAERMQMHRAAVDAFDEAGIGRVVYTSFLNTSPNATFSLAWDHYETEQYLAAKGLPFVALRNSFYLDLLPHFVTDGVIRGPGGEGRFAPVARDDIADVAAAVLVDANLAAGPIDITGPELLTLHDVAKILSDATQQPITYQPETIEEAYASRADLEGSDFEKRGWVTSYQAIAEGELAVVSDTVERLTGHPPMSLREFLAGSR